MSALCTSYTSAQCKKTTQEVSKSSQAFFNIGGSAGVSRQDMSAKQHCLGSATYSIKDQWHPSHPLSHQERGSVWKWSGFLLPPPLPMENYKPQTTPSQTIYPRLCPNPIKHHPPLLPPPQPGLASPPLPCPPTKLCTLNAVSHCSTALLDLWMSRGICILWKVISCWDGQSCQFAGP